MKDLDNYGGISAIVREGIKNCPDRYTINYVERVLIDLGKPLQKSQIGTTLTRFASKTKEIAVLKKVLGTSQQFIRKIGRSILSNCRDGRGK